MPTYYSTLKEFAELTAPAWLRQPQGLAWLRALADAKDGQRERAKQSVKTRFPSFAGREALEQLGRERMLPRGFTEGSSTYAARLQDAWATWETCGTATGILRALHALGYTSVYLVSHLGHVHSLDGSGNLVVTTTGGGTWTPDIPSFWSQFTLVFPTPYRSEWVTGGVPLQDSGEGELIIETVRRWKPPFATLSRIVIQGTGPMWGYPFTASWGGVSRVWGGGTDSIVWTTRV
jgi:hypothetical protein